MRPLYLTMIALLAAFVFATTPSTHAQPTQTNHDWKLQKGPILKWSPIPSDCNYVTVRIGTLSRNWIVSVPDPRDDLLFDHMRKYPGFEFWFVGSWETKCGTQMWVSSDWVIFDLKDNEYIPIGETKSVSGTVKFQRDTFPFASITECNGNTIQNVWTEPGLTWEVVFAQENGSYGILDGVLSPSGLLVPRRLSLRDDVCATPVAKTPAPPTSVPSPRPPTPTTIPMQLWKAYLPYCNNRHSCEPIRPTYPEYGWVMMDGVIVHREGKVGCCQSEWVLVDLFDPQQIIYDLDFRFPTDKHVGDHVILQGDGMECQYNDRWFLVSGVYLMPKPQPTETPLAQ